VSDTDNEAETARDLLAGFGAFEGTERKVTTAAVHRRTKRKSSRRIDRDTETAADE
jgi:hypothetical protein